MPTTWVPKQLLDEAKAGDFLSRAKAETDSWLKGYGYGNESHPATPTPTSDPAFSITLPTAEEWHAAAPWRDLDAPKPVPATPSSQAPAVTASGSSATAVPGAPTPSVPAAAPMPTGQGGEDGDLESWARQEAQRLGIDPETAVRVAKTEGGFDDPTRQNMQGAPAYGPYQLYIGGPENPGLGDEALRAGIDPRNPAHARAAVTYALEHAAKNGWGAFQGAAANGIGDRDGIGQQPPSAPRPAPTTPPQAEQTPSAQAPVPSELYPRQDLLDDPDKWAVCGPLGVMAFGAMTGHPVDYNTAKEAARKAGWTTEGMQGPQSQVAALNNIGVAAKTGPVDLATIQREVRNGNPVGLSSPGGSGHYFTVQGVDDQGRLDLGNSALALRASGGRRWFTLEELRGMGAIGAVDTAIYLDNPASPNPSVAASPQPVGEAAPASVQRARAREQANGAPVLAQSLAEQTASDVGTGQASMTPGPSYIGDVGSGEGGANAWTGSSSGGDMGSVSPFGEALPPNVTADDRPGTSAPSLTGTGAGTTPMQPAPMPTVSSGLPAPQRGTAIPGPLSSETGVSPYDETPPYVAPQMASGAAAEDLPPPAPFIGPEPVPLSQADYEDQARSASQQPQVPPATAGKAWKRPKPIYDAATGEITGYVQEAEEEQTPGVLGAAYDAARAGLQAGGAALTPQSVPEAIEASTGLNPMTLAVPGANPLARRVVNAYNAGVGAAGDVLGRRTAQAAGVSDEPIVPGIPVSGQDVAGYAGGMALDPTTYAGGGGVAKSVAREAPGVIRRVGASAADAAAPIVERGRRVAADVGRGLAGEILDRAIAPRAVGEAGPGIGRALVDTAEAAPRHVYSPTAPEGSVRRYHGTAGAFDAADPARFDENGLYGPGYYTTSDPRVAGSYADAGRGGMSNDEVQTFVQRVADRVRAETGMPVRINPEDFYGMTRQDAIKNVAREVDIRGAMHYGDAQELAEQVAGQVPAASGPNIRPLDLPRDLNMLDADAPLAPETVDRARQMIERARQAAPELADELAVELDRLAADVARRPGYIPNEGLINTLMETGERIARRQGWTDRNGKGVMTEIMERLGYDGINHTGGRIRPMLDGAGNPIEHDVSIVFPGSINKVRNALSGTKGGGFLPFDPASAAAGAAAGGEADEDGNPTYDPMRMAGGALVAGLTARQLPGVQRALQASQRRAARMAAQGIQPLSPLRWTGQLVQSIGYSSMIGLRTAATNIHGNIPELAWSAPKEVVRAALPQRLGGRGAPNEALSWIVGLGKGTKNIPGAARDALLARGQYATNPDQPMLSERTIDPILHAVALLPELGGRVLSGLPDAVFGSIARGAGEERRAAQLATDAIRAGTLPSADRGQFIAQTLADRLAIMTGNPPTDATRLANAQQVLKAGQGHLNDMTYRNPLGTVGKAAKAAIGGDLPVVGPLAVPFHTTPWNIRTRMFEKTPAGFAMNTYDQVGSARTKFDKYYDATVGSAVVAGLVLGPGMSGMITGSGPNDPGQRKLMEANGWRAYHTLMPATDGKWYYTPNRTIGGFGLLLNAVGEAHDAMAYGKKNPRGLTVDAMDRIGKLIGQDTYNQGLPALAAILTDPDNKGAGFLGSLGARLTPYGSTMRDISTATDPKERRPEGGAGVPFEEQVTQRYLGGIGQRAAQPVATDIRGQELDNPQRGWATLLPKRSEYKNDPVVNELLARGVSPGQPRDSFTVTRGGDEAADGGVETAPVRLTAAEQSQWQRDRWSVIQDTYAGLKDDPQYKDAPPTIKAKIWQGVISGAGKMADGQARERMGGSWERRVESAFRQRAG